MLLAGAHERQADAAATMLPEHDESVHVPRADAYRAGGWSIRTMLPEGSRTAQSRVPQG